MELLVCSGASEKKLKIYIHLCTILKVVRTIPALLTRGRCTQSVTMQFLAVRELSRALAGCTQL